MIREKLAVTKSISDKSLDVRNGSAAGVEAVPAERPRSERKLWPPTNSNDEVRYSEIKDEVRCSEIARIGAKGNHKVGKGIEIPVDAQIDINSSNAA